MPTTTTDTTTKDSPSRTASPTVKNGGIILIHDCKRSSKQQQQTEEKLLGLESLLLSSNSMGTLIDSAHERYHFICNMLTGIRICTQKACFSPQLPPSTLEFTFTLKMRFKRGEKLENLHVKESFEFKEYAPAVFARLRMLYGLGSSSSNSNSGNAGEKSSFYDAAYLEELTDKFQMNEMGSPGKSGCFFYYSHSYQFIIKTIRKSEAKFLLRILPAFYAHHECYPESLLARYCGLYRVRQGKRGCKRHFIVMLNIFPPNRTLEEVYDIKGATFGRKVSLKSMQNFIVMKDLNLLENGRKIFISPALQEEFMLQLERDVGFLIGQRAMDYSLLLGISRRRRKSSSMEAEAEAEEEKEQLFLHPNSFFPGSQSTDYYMGIIDVLTPWNWKKKLEHFFRGCCIYRNEISAVCPTLYGERFLGFVQRLFEEVAIEVKEDGDCEDGDCDCEDGSCEVKG